ncbi:MAG: hypothetical protein H7246_17000 [Phycisphaerae bacterium]|nr:hypothetical protein [Saprospiraceae bacterium]
MKKLFRIMVIALPVVAGVWTLLTLWAESAGSKRSWELGKQASRRKVLIVYDPDPFYNLDEQISRSFGQALADQGMHVRVATAEAAREFKDQPFDLYVFCANTYNWRPDWVVSNFIKKQVVLENKSVVAITLGSGSTEASQKTLEELILKRKGNLLDSRSLWLTRPNDESRGEESNTKVSVSMAYAWGEQIAKRID